MKRSKCKIGNGSTRYDVVHIQHPTISRPSNNRGFNEGRHATLLFVKLREFKIVLVLSC